MSFKHFDDFILVDGPVENEVIFLGCDQDGTIMMGVAELLYLMGFHEEFSVRLGIGSEVYIERLWVCDIENFAIIGEINSNYVLSMVFDDFGWFQAFQQTLVELNLHY